MTFYRLDKEEHFKLREVPNSYDYTGVIHKSEICMQDLIRDLREFSELNGMRIYLKGVEIA